MNFDSKKEEPAKPVMKDKLASSIENRKLQELEKKLITAQIAAQKAKENLYKAYQDLHEKEKAYQEIQQSLSFRIGWVMTAPFRWVYDRIYGSKLPPKTEKSTSAVGLSPQIKLTDQAFFQLLPKVRDYNLEERLAFENQRLQFFGTAELKESPYRPSILFAIPNIPAFDLSSGDKRLFRIMSLLTESCEVYIFTLGEQPKKYVDALENQGIQVYKSKNPHDLRKTIPYLDALIFSWYYTLFECLDLTKLFPEAKVIVDSVDVHWLRESRALDTDSSLDWPTVEKNKEKEILAYQAADLVWAVTTNDQAEILSQAPESQVAVVSNVHSVAAHPDVSQKPPVILFFGGYQHQPNRSALKLLADEIFPVIVREIPTARLLIVGSKAPPEIVELGKRPGIEYIGFVEETEIPKIYQRSQITIIPLLAGAGIKGKICEAIAHGTTVITNDLGNEGIGLIHLEEGIITNSPKEMAGYAIKAFNGELPLEKMVLQAQARLKRLVSPELVKKNAIASIFPHISICIVSWNRKELLQKCLLSVIENTGYPNYTILVYSNGCTDGTQEYLQELAQQDPRIEPVLSTTNDVFVRPNNHLMTRYPDADVALLNNDVEVAPGWLMELYRAAYLSPEIGVSGSKVLYPDGSMQEFGAELYANGTGKNIGKWDDPEKPEYNQLTNCGYVSGCAMFIKRSTIKKIGTFDDQFHPCYCEDSDFCYTAREQGLVTVVTPRSIIYHHEGATSGTNTESGFKAFQQINMQKFLDKHRGKENGIDWSL